MSFDPKQLEKSFAFDPETVAGLRESWSELIVAVVWDDLKSGTIGALPRLRKRVLEVGENLRSLLSDRRWIPHERERVKGAMAASLNLRDSLLQADRAAKLVAEGSDFPRFEARYLAFRQQLLAFIETHEQIWADLLESLYSDDADED
ncbi:hypothetical protein [Thioalkalivibrio sp.]|uniref:hypothetical protein n=1 Tax=Thioalkalivibrio sp. TaxID=2093813 RepID=UPI0012D6B06B|nr:hypothetical protein [Thioalkalivibrio sp.]TVP81540.1 MAG: hypothetical protein EA346_05040 [Thioalkalivibrio sp.]